MALSPELVLPFIQPAGIEVSELYAAVTAEHPEASPLDLHLALVILDLRGLASEDEYVVSRTSAI